MSGSLDDSARCRVAAQRGTAAGRLREIQHADDVRRQRQDDVGLLRLLVVVARTAVRSTGRSLSPGTPDEHGALVVADQAGEHVGFAVLQPDRRA